MQSTNMVALLNDMKESQCWWNLHKNVAVLSGKICFSQASLMKKCQTSALVFLKIDFTHDQINLMKP